ncbi:MAG: acylphosphatase [Anaerolineae bacterium]|jgi:acylphosphatase|nr:acylphosphatase [Anaerolineae bacterium]MBT7073105.1 acylphosphatase [Anaerolineae bacterium]MBT7323916.1 acylphosphatase [Anaerolineae bacterium]
MTVKEEKASLHIHVYGRVQGVGFRAFVAQQATHLDLKGWVRNVGRDQVETRAEGTREALDAFLDKVKRGPSVARVDRSEVEWGECREEFKRFKVRWF